MLTDTQLLQKLGNSWVKKMLKSKITYTKPGSISYLLYGKRPSEQSINIKFGKFGEFLAKEMVKMNSNLQLLECGIIDIGHKKKDLDLLFLDKKSKIIYYRELKANIELDTEKVVATINKCHEINEFLIDKYPEYEIDSGILNWSVFNRKNLKVGIQHIKKFEDNLIKINHVEDFAKLIEITWNEQEFNKYFRKLGKRIIDNY